MGVAHALMLLHRIGGWHGCVQHQCEGQVFLWDVIQGCKSTWANQGGGHTRQAQAIDTWTGDELDIPVVEQEEWIGWLLSYKSSVFRVCGDVVQASLVHSH